MRKKVRQYRPAVIFKTNLIHRFSLLYIFTSVKKPIGQERTDWLHFHVDFAIFA